MNENYKKKKKTDSAYGFTLIELLVVISIIGLLASIGVVAASQARLRGRDGKRIADINQLSKALELYFDDNKGYPTAVAGGVLLNATNIPGMVPKYLTHMPVSPAPADGPCVGVVGRGGNDYWYEGNSSGANLSTVYTLTFCLGVGQSASLGPGAHWLSGGAFH